MIIKVNNYFNITNNENLSYNYYFNNYYLIIILINNINFNIICLFLVIILNIFSSIYKLKIFLVVVFKINKN
jgi:hypothetical protein